MKYSGLQSQLVKVKICCISSISEAALAMEQGADVLGLVGHMPSGPGIISDELAADIVRFVDGRVETFLLTSETTADSVIAHHQKVGSSAIQLVDALPAGSHQVIRQALPDVKLIQVVHVTNGADVEHAVGLSTEVDELLLDSGNPNLEIKELGGTGRTHDWRLSASIVKQVKVPVFLAGGLQAENVVQAVTQVQPSGLDLCSGVRKDGELDAASLSAFMQQVRLINH